MGYASWTDDTRAEYASRSTVNASLSRDQLFQSKTVRKDFDPKNITLRESCDSDFNPESTPIIVGLDVTGSMGMIAEHIAKQGLGTLVESIIDTKPVSDPHIMMMAIGDINYDSAPLQATHFEADMKIAEQLEELWLEGGGGGNRFESYDLPWLFAARKTRTDSWDKRGKKGYVFTMGDEFPPTSTNRGVLNESLGFTSQTDLTAEDMLNEARERYNVFHIVVEEGWFAKSHLSPVREKWLSLMGRHAIMLKNYKHVSEVITAIIQVNEGEDPDSVINAHQDKSVRETLTHALYFNDQTT